MLRPHPACARRSVSDLVGVGHCGHVRPPPQARRTPRQRAASPGAGIRPVDRAGARLGARAWRRRDHGLRRSDRSDRRWFAAAGSDPSQPHRSGTGADIAGSDGAAPSAEPGNASRAGIGVGGHRPGQLDRGHPQQRSGPLQRPASARPAPGLRHRGTAARHRRRRCGAAGATRASDGTSRPARASHPDLRALTRSAGGMPPPAQGRSGEQQPEPGQWQAGAQTAVGQATGPAGAPGGTGAATAVATATAARPAGTG
ncbi:MAG: hypothetical protein QOF18_621 [Frankiaceae bacterium]|nr:hypothetical protein [Frankiaceae bacterium]